MMTMVTVIDNSPTTLHVLHKFYTKCLYQYFTYRSNRSNICNIPKGKGRIRVILEQTMVNSDIKSPNHVHYQIVKDIDIYTNTNIFF